MTLGRSRARFALAYVDELLANFASHPQKSIQFVFQRLLLTCGGPWKCVAIHASDILLCGAKAIQLSRDPSLLPSEQHASQLIALIVKFATEHQKGRSECELRGAHALFTCLMDRCSEHLMEFSKQQNPEMTRHYESVLWKALMSCSDTPQQCAMLASFTVGTNYHVLDTLAEDPFTKFFSDFSVAGGERCNLRAEYLVRIVFLVLRCRPPGVDLLDMSTFIQKILEDDDHRDRIETRTLQPLLRSLFAQETNQEMLVSRAVLSSTINDVISKKVCSLMSVEEALVETKRTSLASVIWAPEVTADEATIERAIKLACLDPAVFFSAEAISETIIRMVTLPPYVGDSTSVQWNARVFVSACKRHNGNLSWTDVVKYFDCPWFRVAGRNGLILLTNIILEAFTDTAFPIDFLYTTWQNPLSQYSWLRNIVENPEVFPLSSFPHRSVCDTVLKHPSTGIHADTWRCLDLVQILLSLGRENLSIQVKIRSFFVQGAALCPDILLLSILQLELTIYHPFTVRMIELALREIIPAHPNFVEVVNYAWNLKGRAVAIVRSAIMRISVVVHKKCRSDPVNGEKMEKDLLLMIFNLNPSGVTLFLDDLEPEEAIRVACIASIEDVLDLDTWLSDKYTNEGVGEAVLQTVEALFINRTTTKKLDKELSVLISAAQKLSATASFDPRLLSVFEEFPELNIHKGISDVSSSTSSAVLDNVAIQKEMRESGRSSSVSSTGRAPLAGYQQGSNNRPGPPLSFPNNPAPSFSPLATYMQQPQSQPSSGNPVGLGNMFGNNAFGGSQDLVQPTPNINFQVGGSAGSSRQFGDTSQAGNGAGPGLFNRSTPSQPPRQPERQNSSSSSWSLPGGIPAPGQRPPGPPTPSQQMDFRAQLPPTGAQTDFQARPVANAAVSDDLSQMTFSEDIQEEANGYFEQIYSPTGVLTVHDLIERLKKFKTSTVLRDQKVLSCVVKNLFEEYRFFVDYPDRELKTTAEVYGGIIREGIISNLHFATAVRKVIESLNADPTSKLWTFGIVSLDHCRNKLCAYPKVCSMIAQLDNFNRFPPRLQEFVLAGVRGEHPTSAAAAEGRSTPPVWQQMQPPRTGSADSSKNGSLPANRTGNSVLSYTNVDTLVQATEKEGADVAQPAEVIVDKMSFLFNNLSQSNMVAKKEEVLTLITEQGEPFVRWLAQYIVMKRVSIEQNFQPLYNTFVQAVDHPLLDLHIKRETFRNIRILLRSDKRQAASNYSDRQLLKNLGMWLGSITIARSKPILIHELDLKSLLMEAYYKGQQELLFVVPFIAKILFSCSKTQIFSASCAWIRSILKILAELHNEPDLKINLKFEIEVLCKELNVELHLLPMEGVLKDTDRLLRVQQQLSELRLLARPEVLPSSSPVPSQMRLAPEAAPTPGNDTKPGTPAVDADAAANLPESTQQGHFGYHDINVISYEGLVPHLQIKASLPLFQLHPQVKQVVKPALTHAIKELIGPVAERAQKIAMTVTENLISKDFAMDPDEKNLKISAFHMMRAMTAGMAMITCRDPLASSMLGYLTNSFQNALRTVNSTPDHVRMIEEAAQVITQDNVELATNFIVKTACEKAASEMEKRLEPLECQKRAAARRDGTSFVNEAAEGVHALLPPRIATQKGPTNKDLLDIYAQFSSRICGFKPTVSEESAPEAGRHLVMPESDKQCDVLSVQLDRIIKEIDTTMTSQPNMNNKAYQAVGVIRDLLSHLAMNPRDQLAVISVITKSVEHLLHAFHVDPTTKNPLDVEWPRRLRDLFIGVTRVLLGWLPIADIARRITSTIVGLNVEYKWNVEAMEVLLKHNLLQTSALDSHIATKINGGSNLEATMFAQRFFRALCGGNDATKYNILKEAFPATFEQLVKVHQMQSSARAPAPGETAGGVDSPVPTDILGNAREEGDISQKVVEGILREWISLCYTPMAQRNPQEALSQMIHTMHEHGVLSTDDKVTTFFRMCTEMCVDVTLRMLKQDPGTSFHQTTIIRQRCYYTLDAYVRLIALMIKHSDGSQAQTKITLLKKVLSIVTGVLQLDHEVRRTEFNPMPYHRILISLFNELTTADGNAALEPIAWNILEAFGQALFVLQPRRCPGFAFAWLDIVGHRNVIGRLLGGTADTTEAMKMQAMYTQLIICHLKFLAPFLRNIHLPKSIAVLYKGTLRVLLVILHDFPELLCEFHYVICDTIPPNCVQLRNLVLSAYPRNMRLPDPFALGFKQVDTLPDMAQEPKSNLNMATIIPDNIRLQLDEYLSTRTAVDFLSSLPGLLQVSQTPGSKYNTTVMNAVVLYVGIRAIESLHQRRQHINIHTIAHTAFMDVFQNLAVQLCTEGRYLLFNAIANQLRYPNAHTHYFSCVFLFLFLNSDCDAIQEQITRILFERLVALRPHPWGLLITFIELIKNPVYNFWKYEFTRCAPEIERLFQNVANTCVPSTQT